MYILNYLTLTKLRIQIALARREGRLGGVVAASHLNKFIIRTVARLAPLDYFRYVDSPHGREIAFGLCANQIIGMGRGQWGRWLGGAGAGVFVFLMAVMKRSKAH